MKSTHSGDSARSQVSTSTETPEQLPIWRDTTRPVAQRVVDLISRMTLPEKIAQLMMQCPEIPRLKIAAYDWWSEALHGVGRNGIATVFPQAIGLGATWNPKLLREIGDAISTEARAKHHAEARANGGASGRYQGLTLWSPNVNLFRDPRWGRGQECYGEDVCLTSRLGTAFVRGLQGEDPRYLKTVATPKHFAVHSGPEDGRFAFNALVSQRDLWEEELSVFEFVIRDGQAWSVMSSYNGINGIPSAASHWLLTEVLRNRWGFRGAVVGDVDNVAQLTGARGMGYAKDEQEACAFAIKAGQDLCSGWAFTHLDETVSNGLVTERELDRNLARNLELRFRLGLFDPEEQVGYAQIPLSAVDSPEHDTLALEAARQSVVLLKNEGVLPLDPLKLHKVAILGPTADNQAALLGNYSGVPSRPTNLLDGIRRKLLEHGVEVTHFRAVPVVEGLEREGNPLDASECLFADASAQERGLKAEVFNHPDFQGASVIGKIGLNLFWNIYQPLPPIPPEDTSIRWTGFLIPPVPGEYIFTLECIGGFRLSIGSQVVLDELQAPDASLRKSRIAAVHLQAGPPIPVLLEFRQTCGEGLVSLWWRTPLDPEDNLATALDAAREADHIILCLGLTPEVEGEEMPVDFEGFKAGDRTTILLPTPQRELLEKASALGKPTTVILTTGSALAFDISKADAILCAWYYGQRGGNAVAEVLLGETNPAGRLPVTFYASDADLPPIENYSMDGRTYKYFPGKPLFAFGHGLSYTTFRYGQPQVESATVFAGATALLKIAVTNTGKRDGDEVVQVYGRDPHAGPDRPTRQLLGFQRQNIPAGQTREVAITLDTRLLRHWDDSVDDFVFDEKTWMLEIGPASDQLLCTCQLTIQNPTV